MRLSLQGLKNYLKLVYTKANKSEVDALYSLLYDVVHDFDGPPPLFVKQTQQTFSFQWEQLSEGEAMLSDVWFKENVPQLIAEHEILVDPSWFKGKKVLDLGCGGGRWSYGLAKLGAELTCVDVNASAIESTRNSLKELGVTNAKFVQSPIESLDNILAEQSFDLVWSWGVLHHCVSFNRALDVAARLVKPGGLLYLYLYGRESVSYVEDIGLFKKRLRYYSLKSWEEKKQYLLQEASGDEKKIHQLHDLYAPLINRRVTFEQVADMLKEKSFVEFLRTVNHTEVFLRAVKGAKGEDLDKALIYSATKQHWFSRYH